MAEPTPAGATPSQTRTRPSDRRGHATSPSTAARPVTLSFAGDVHFATKLAPLLDHPSTALSSLVPYLGSSDLAMVNLETAITTRGTAQPKQYHFRAPATAFQAVASGGIDAVTMANNHAADYGSVGLADTLAGIAKSPIPVVGIGADAAAAYAPAYLDLRGTRVALLAAMQVPDWTAAHFAAGPHSPGVATAFDPSRLAAAVRAAKRKADVVVVFMHWGTEYTTCPNALQQSTAKALADSRSLSHRGRACAQADGCGLAGPHLRRLRPGQLRLVATADDRRDLDRGPHADPRRSPGRRGQLAADGRGRERAAGGARAPTETAKLAAYWKGLRHCTGLAAHPS